MINCLLQDWMPPSLGWMDFYWLTFCEQGRSGMAGCWVANEPSAASKQWNGCKKEEGEKQDLGDHKLLGFARKELQLCLSQQLWLKLLVPHQKYIFPIISLRNLPGSGWKALPEIHSQLFIFKFCSRNSCGWQRAGPVNPTRTSRHWTDFRITLSLFHPAPSNCK